MSELSLKNNFYKFDYLKQNKISNFKKMKLGVIFVNYNSGHYLKRCLDSLFSALDGNDYEILIIDNASKDASLEYVQSRYPNLTVIKNKNNLGFASAVNMGIKTIKCDYILLINPDSVILDHSISKMVDFMGKTSDCGVLGGWVTYPDGRRQESCRRFPTFWRVVLGRRSSVLYRLFPNNPFSRDYLMTSENLSKTQEVDFVAGSFMMLRKKALDEVGLFDEDFFLYVEDADLCFRMKQHGWKVFFYPEARCLHYYGENIRQDNIRPEIYHAKSMYKFYKKHYHLNWIALLLLKTGLWLKAAQILSWGFLKRTYIR
jgi:GT2 family glycosyltransferase